MIKNNVNIASNFLWIYPIYFAFCVIIIHLRQVDALLSDEPRFLGYALYILQGQYAMPSDTFIWNGPGLPILLTPFVKLGFNPMLFRFLNAVFLTLNLFLCLRIFELLKFNNLLKLSLIVILCLYPPIILDSLNKFMTEIPCITFISLTVYNFIIYEKSKKLKHIVYAALSGSFLILTKVLFFYVLLFCLVLLVIKKIITPKKTNLIKLNFICLVFVIPYLMYTFSLTKKFPFLANSGGMQLYWMTVSGKNHHGDWHPFPGDWNPYPSDSDFYWEHDESKIKSKSWYNENSNTFKQWKTYNPIDANSFLFKTSINNIINYPYIYLKNISYNIVRFYFNVPKDGKWNLKQIVINSPNIILIIAFLIALYSFFKPKASNKSEGIYLALLITLAYTSASFLLSAYARFSYILLPLALILIGDVIQTKQKQK